MKPQKGKTKWWKDVKQGVEVPVTFIKVPFTPGSKLVKRFQEVTRKHNFPIKFVETPGTAFRTS